MLPNFLQSAQSRQFILSRFFFMCTLDAPDKTTPAGNRPVNLIKSTLKESNTLALPKQILFIKTFHLVSITTHALIKLLYEVVFSRKPLLIKRRRKCFFDIEERYNQKTLE